MTLPYCQYNKDHLKGYRKLDLVNSIIQKHDVDVSFDL